MNDRDVLFATLASMRPKARAAFVRELPDFYCAGCGGDLQNGRCRCPHGTTEVTFKRDGSVQAVQSRRAR